MGPKRANEANREAMYSRALRGSIFLALALMTGLPVAASQDTPRAQDSPFKRAIPLADLVLGRRQQAEYHPSATQDEGGGEPPAQESGDEEQLEDWSFMGRAHDRLRWDLLDGKLRFRVGAALQVDGTVVAGDDEFELNYGEADDSLEVRRARVNTTGTLWGLLFSLQYDFGQDPGVKDAYLEMLGKRLKFTNLRVGNFKEPFSLERQTSNAYTAFLERSLPVTTFAPGRNFGVQFFNPILGERATWALGAFTNTGNPLDDDGSGASDLTLTGRVTGLPWYAGDGSRLLHLGISFSARSPENDLIQYRSRPEARSTPYIVDTGPFEASSNTLLGLELAGTIERTWFMAEFLQSQVRASDSGDPTFEGYYAQIGHFLTKDKKPYDTVTGVFGHPLPDDPFTGGTLQALDSLRPFRHGRPRGAWEVVGRFSHVDLDDGSIQGGKATDLSGAVNWYLNSYVRFELNYVHTKIEDSGSANMLLGRLQFTF